MSSHLTELGWTYCRSSIEVQTIVQRNHRGAFTDCTRILFAALGDSPLVWGVWVVSGVTGQSELAGCARHVT